MPRKQGLNKTLAFRVPDEAYRDVEAARTRERRIESDVCRALLLRGLATYKRDGLLFEPQESKPKRLRRA